MKEMIEKAIEYAGLLIKPPLSEVGLMLQDGVKYWRYKRQVRLIEKVKEFHLVKGISPNPVSLKIFANIIESSSLEEDDGLHNMWAILLAKASSPGHRSNTNLFSSILKELSPEEANILRLMFDKYLTDDKYYRHHGFRKPIALRIEHSHSLREIDYEVLKEENDKEEIIIDNLVRLNLISSGDTTLRKGVGFARRPKEYVQLTRLGMEFIKEVTGNDDSSTKQDL